MRWKTDLRERTIQFAVDVLVLHPDLARRGDPGKHIANQLFRAASSIGAHLEEGQVASSRRDMGAKYVIALREARESRHWLRILLRGEIALDRTRPLEQEANEFVAMLTEAVRKLRGA